MKRLLIIQLVSLFINSYYLQSQTSISVDKWMEYVEDMREETEDDSSIETLYADLSYLSEHPFDLNTVTREELKRLPFLTDLQIDYLLEYRTRYGKMATLYELKNVESLDFQTISLLLPFVRIREEIVEKRPFTVNNLFKYGSNNLQIRYDKCFQQKKGYGSYPDSVLQQYPNRKYLGEPFYHSLRYAFTFDDRLQAGFVAEKDAGEPFWNRTHKGYDFYSAHLFLKNRNPWLKSLAIGDYKASFGQGLAVSHDFSPGRNILISQAERRTNGFRRHFSTDETNFLRGMAATLSFRNTDISLFYSYRHMDANTDSLAVRSFKTDGLHRLPGEREKKRVVPMQVYGGNIRYATPAFSLGVTALSYSFGSFRIEPDTKPYNLFYFRGNRNANVSVDYRLKNKRIKFYGETALSSNGAVATLNALQLTPVSYFSWLLLYRYYDRRYQAFFGNAFSQGTTVQNEQGVYTGMQWTPAARWKLSAYADIFRFPWLKYGIDAPSGGQEYNVQVDYNRDQLFSFYIRYRYKQADKNRTQKEQSAVSVLPYQRQQLRFQLCYSPHPDFSFRTSADGIFYKEKPDRHRGGMIAQSAGWKPRGFPFQADLYIAWFQTDNSLIRISSYERNILYAFNKPSFYGRGVRMAFSFRWEIVNRLLLSAKWGYTRYTDRERIGTGTEEIEGPSKMDLNVLLSWKF